MASNLLTPCTMKCLALALAASLAAASAVTACGGKTTSSSYSDFEDNQLGPDPNPGSPPCWCDPRPAPPTPLPPIEVDASVSDDAGAETDGAPPPDAGPGDAG